jgi:hypothetical protein
MSPHSERLAECEDFKARVEKFMEESNGKDGYRSRLGVVELRLSTVEKGVMQNAIVGGIIGALIGSGAAPAVTKVVELFLH